MCGEIRPTGGATSAECSNSEIRPTGGATGAECSNREIRPTGGTTGAEFSNREIRPIGGGNRTTESNTTYSALTLLLYFIAAIVAEHALLTNADQEWMWKYGVVYVDLILYSNQEVELETSEVGG